MATNPALDYGLDVGCTRDADPMWTEVSGMDLLRQDTFHVLTCDDFLGPGGDGRGYNMIKLLGMKASDLAAQQPIIIDRLIQDDRIDSADVSLVPVMRHGQLVDVNATIVCKTAAGPFTLTFPVSSLSDLGASDQ